MKIINQYLSINAIEDDDTYCWVANYAFPGLFQIEKKTMNVKLLYAFHETYSGSSKRLIEIIKQGEILYLFPAYTHEIMSYNLRTGEVLNIVHGKKLADVNRDRSEWISSAVKVNNKIWIFPAYLTSPILVLDLCKLTVEELEWDSIMLNYMKKSEDGAELKINNVIWNGMYFVGVFRNTGDVFRMRVDKKCEIIHFEDVKFNFMTYDGINYWVTLLNENAIFFWNGNDEKKIIPLSDHQSDNILTFYKVFVTERRLIVVPYLAESIYVASRDEKVFREIVMSSDFKRIHDVPNRGSFTQYFVYKEKIILVPYGENQALIYDEERENIQGQPLIMTDNEYDLCINEFMSAKTSLIEGEFLSLDYYLDQLSQMEREECDTKSQEFCGKKILKEIVLENR